MAFVTFEHRLYSHDPGTRLRADAAAADLCQSTDFTFCLASLLMPPWSAATVSLVDADRLAAFVRLLGHADVIDQLVNTMYKLAELALVQTGEVARIETLYLQLQKDVEVQLDDELVQLKATDANMAAKTPAQWQTLRRHLFGERMRLILQDCQQAIDAISDKFSRQTQELEAALPMPHADMCEQFALTPEHLFSYLIFAHHFRADHIRYARPCG